MPQQSNPDAMLSTAKTGAQMPKNTQPTVHDPTETRMHSHG
jgi:hypothetical protein